MNQQTSSSQSRKPFRLTPAGISLKISLTYAAFGCLWILFSDRAMALLVNKPELLLMVSLVKGWFFIIFTACMLFLMVLHSTRRYKQQQRQLRDLINSIPDLVWLKDMKGEYLFCNPSFERFFGAKESEIVGRTDYDFVSRDLADFFRHQVYRLHVHAGRMRRRSPPISRIKMKNGLP